MSQVARERHLQMLKTAFGPEIMALFEDNDVIEIMLNPDGELFVEKLSKGKHPAGIAVDPEQSENIIKLVASYQHEITDREQPMVAAELPFYGARFQGWLSPVVAKPTFSIRKRAIKIFTLEDYKEKGALTDHSYEVLLDAVRTHKNIVIVGGTSSGKTTFANALLQVLEDSDERVILMEDVAELQIKAKDLVSMVTSPEVGMRDLVKGSLRMRPDRIVIGEVRDGAALELLKAWNTGHPGGVCTLHANSVESTPYRLEDLIQEAVVTVPKNLIMQAVDIIVYIERSPSGERKVKNIAKLVDLVDNHYVLENVV